jgi:antitoxin HigA-1
MMARKRALQPANPIHPGAMLLEEFLQPADKSQAAFAREIGWTKARLNEFIKGKRGVTADGALDLGDVLGTSPRLWMNLQSTYDLAEATRRRSVA